MRLRYFVISCVALCFVVAGAAQARTYAGNLDVELDSVSQSGTQKIQYRLNDDAATVTIEVKDSGSATVRTLDASEADAAQRPGLSQGLNVVEWDMKDDGGTTVPLGSYSFSIATTDVGYATWTNITPYEPTSTAGYTYNATETVVSARFYAPYGVGVLKDKTDPNFGRIYVANGTVDLDPSAATGALNVKSGVYFLNCDLSLETGDPNTSGWLESAAGTMWNSASAVNPYGLDVFEDRGVFITGGYSDGWEDLYVVDLDGSSYVKAFDRASYSDGSDFDNCIASAITGVGASTTLWGGFEYMNGYVSIGSWVTGWPITGAVSATPTIEIDDSGAVNGVNGIASTMYSIRHMVTSADENYLYFSNARWGVSQVACAKMDISGPTSPQIVGDTHAWRDLITDPEQIYGNFRSVGIMVDPVDGVEKLVLQKYYGVGNIYIVDADDMSLLDEFEPDPGQGSGTVGMTVFDPVGNVIYTSVTYEWLRFYAPPSAPFSFDIDYAGTFQVVQVTGLSEEDWDVYR